VYFGRESNVVPTPLVTPRSFPHVKCSVLSNERGKKDDNVTTTNGTYL